MRLGALFFFSGTSCATESSGRALRGSETFPLVVLAIFLSATSPAHSAQFEEMAVPDLPWSTLPAQQNGARVLQLSVPRPSFAVETDPFPSSKIYYDSELVGISWMSETTSLFLGAGIDEESRKTDRLFGAFRKKWKKKSAVYVFDYTIGFSTDFVVDVLSKNKQRGLKDFKILQLSLSSSPFAGDGNITAASALTLNGLTPELNVGIRLYLPFGNSAQ